ncbi:MAG: polysaccharide biosynthesis protein [Nanoarchaeota archaeon]
MKLEQIYNSLISKGNTLKDTFYKKDILITGGCGSIGSEIVKQLIKYNPKRIKVFDNNESGLFYLQQRLNSPLIRTLVGDIRDRERLRMAVRGTDIIFHAAALKHVPLCEYNPFEAVYTNVIGTQNLVGVARDEQVDKFITISTDKAVNPINTMGATKLLSEKLVMTADIGDWCKTKFSCVRFGNVLDSIASVIPIFKRQIKRGGPVTITSKEMVRFFMSMPEAVNLVLKTASLAKGRDIFILKMDKIKIIDLAEVMIEKIAPQYGHKPEDIKIKTIGIRPGEKLDEQLITEEEKEFLMDLGELYILKKPRIPHFRTSLVIKTKDIKERLDINNGRLLSKDEIGILLKKFNLC